MSLKKFKPTTPGQRHKIVSDYSEVTTNKPEKSLTKGSGKSGGRNNYGHLTSRKKGGGHKRKYRIVDFKRNLVDVPAVIERIEYDPNRSAHIALVKYKKDGEFSYIILPQKLKVGDEVISSEKTEIKPGNCLQIKN